MSFERWRKRIEPVHGADEILKRRIELNSLDIQRQHGYALAHSALDLAVNLARFVRIRRDDDQQHSTGLYCPDYRTAPLQARSDVARRNPAPYAFGFQNGASRVGCRVILVRVADEDIV